MPHTDNVLQFPDPPDEEGYEVFTDSILRHWEQAFPRQFRKLKKAGVVKLRALDAAKRAAFVLEQCAAANVDWGVSQELAAEIWGPIPEG